MSVRPTAGRSDAITRAELRRVIIMLAAVLGLSAADTGAIGSLAAPLERTFHIGNTRLGLLVSVATLLGAVATLPFGSLADRVNRTRLLKFAVFTWGAATAISALSVSYTMLLITRGLLGLLVAAAGPLVTSLAGDLFPPEQRSRLFGLVLSGELIGGGFGIVVAGTLSDLLGWRPALAVLALPAGLLAVAIGRLFPEPARSNQQPGAPTAGEGDRTTTRHWAAQGERRLWPAVRLTLGIRTNVVLIVASSLGYFFLQGLETFAELFFRGRYGVGQSLASVLFIFIAISAIGGVLLSGRVADGLLARGRTNARIVVAAVAFALTPVFFVPGLAFTTLVVSLPLFILAGMAIGAVNPPLDAARLDVVPASLWGRAEAVRTTLRSIFQGAAPIVFGLVSSAFGPSISGLGAGIDSSATATSAASGHALAVTFAILAIPLLVAGAVLAADRRQYPRDLIRIPQPT